MTVPGPPTDSGVLVVGGGPAGIAAALAAARTGDREVVLLEREDRIGGNVSQAFVHTICGLFLPSADHEAIYAHDGLPRAFTEELRRRGGAGDVEWAGAAGFVPIDPEAFAGLAREALDDAGVVVKTGIAAAGLSWDGERGGAFTFDPGTGGPCSARTVIDASGDGSAAHDLGVATDAATPDELQHASWILRIDGVDTAAFDRMERARTSTWLAREATLGSVDPALVSVVFRPGRQDGSVYATINLPKPGGQVFDPLDPRLAAYLNGRAAESATALVEALRRHRAPFAGAREGSRPARFGIRETRRVRGLARLEVDAVLEGRRTDDEACVTTWPVEIWNSHRRMEFRHVAGPASIPVGCLVADHPSRRLAVAGRCASASHEALGAIRVIGTAMAMGEAAGVLCALAAGKGTGSLEKVPLARLRKVIAGGATSRLA